jgi:hypothetical protein
VQIDDHRIRIRSGHWGVCFVLARFKRLNACIAYVQVFKWFAGAFFMSPINPLFNLYWMRGNDAEDDAENDDDEAERVSSFSRQRQQRQL